jgi:hypothetical protein
VDADSGGRDLAGWPEVGEKGEQVLVLGEVLGGGEMGGVWFFTCRGGVMESWGGS